MIGSDMVPSLPSAARDIINPTDNSDAVFYEQEETRAIRTQEWSMPCGSKDQRNFNVRSAFDLRKDQREDQFVDDPSCEPIIARLRQQLITYFETYSVPNIICGLGAVPNQTLHTNLCGRMLGAILGRLNYHVNTAWKRMNGTHVS